MYKLALTLFASSFLTCLSGCQPKAESNSAVKFDEKSRSELNKLLSQRAEKLICSKTPIFFFFGNAEGIVARMGDRDGEAIIPNDKLTQIVRDSAEELRKALGLLTHGCENAFKDANKTPQALLVSVIDGPTAPDSQIRTTWFDFTMQRARANQESPKTKSGWSSGWDVSSENYWVLEDDEIRQAKSDKEVFELSMPDAVEKIARHFLKEKPPGSTGEFRFDQTVYIFKTHGAEFFDIEGTLDYKAHFRRLRQTPLPKARGTAFLFDPHGAKPPRNQGSELYYPYVTTKDCQRFAEATSEKDPAPGAEMCEKCKSQLSQVKSLGAFAQCSYPFGNTAKAKTKNDELGMNTDSTLGMNTDSTLGMNTDSTLGTGPGSGAATLGSGKGNVYTKKPADEFPTIHHLGRAVVYSGDASIDGMVKVSLPALGTRETPPLVILDSCHGKSDIGASLFESDSKLPLVTVSNPNAMGMASIKYSELRFAHYMTLAHLESETHLNQNVSKDLAAAMDDFEEHLLQEGIGKEYVDKATTRSELDKLPTRDQIDEEEAKLKRLEIQVIVNGKPVPKIHAK